MTNQAAAGMERLHMESTTPAYIDEVPDSQLQGRAQQVAWSAFVFITQ